jgi:non-lysosomal glucosylceramidase
MRISRRELFLGAAAVTAAGQAPSGRQRVRKSEVGRRFTGESLAEVAFPLGGIGTGTVSLGGCGNLRDWEIFNRPNKGGILPFTFAALRLDGGGLSKPLIRVLERRPHPPFTGASGVPRETTLGLPRFREAVFTGAYPFAHIRFQDPKLPVEVTLEAFNPMIPLDTDSRWPSSLTA